VLISLNLPASLIYMVIFPMKKLSKIRPDSRFSKAKVQTIILSKSLLKFY